MNKNGNRKDSKKGGERTETGQFVKGWSGGPGRGKTKSHVELKEAIEEVKSLLLDSNANLTDSKALAPVGRILLQGITSKDSKVRIDSTKLYLSWLPKMNEAEVRGKDDTSGSPEKALIFRIGLAVLEEIQTSRNPEYTEEMRKFDEPGNPSENLLSEESIIRLAEYFELE